MSGEDFKIINEKDQILRTVSAEWNFSSEEKTYEIARTLEHMMFKHRGIGLAANQIGILSRVFVMGDATNSWYCFNPEIVERRGVVEKEAEGCISFPNLVLDIERHSIILVRYSTLDGQLKEEELSGIWAKVFQHELDHIDGICFDQRVSKLALNIAQRKRMKLSKRKA